MTTFFLRGGWTIQFKRNNNKRAGGKLKRSFASVSGEELGCPARPYSGSHMFWGVYNRVLSLIAREEKKKRTHEKNMADDYAARNSRGNVTQEDGHIARN